MNSRIESQSQPQRVLLVIVNGLGPSMIGGYGNEWIRTPNIDRLCTRGIAFDRHYSTNTDHLVASNAWHASDSHLIEDCNRAGIATIHIRHDVPPTDSLPWVFDEVAERDVNRPWSLLPVRRQLYTVLDGLPHHASIFVVIETQCLHPPWSPLDRWLNYYFVPDEDDEEPLMPWLDAMPKTVAKDDHKMFERLQSTFGANVTSFDRSFGKLLAGCRVRGFGTKATTILTSNLGFSIGEQESIGQHHGLIQESLVHLPLVIRLPDNRSAGSRISALTHSGDLASIIRTRFHLDKVPPSQPVSIPERNYLRIFGNGEEAVMTQDALLVKKPGQSRLFLLPSDRWQTHDVASTMENEVIHLEGLLNQAAN